MAGALIAPPLPGMVPRPGPPARLRALRIFADPPDLAAALAQVAPWLARPRRVLLQVRYTPEHLSPVEGRAHHDFLQQYPQVAGYLPFCLPGSPQHATLGVYATPTACDTCIFREGRACPGLVGDGLADAAAPLAALDRPVEAYGAADFAAPLPVAWWQPTEAHLAAIVAAVQPVGGALWDIGGANGYLAARLAARGLAVTVIDPIEWPTPPGVRRVVADVRDFVRDSGERCAALLTSWPPTGDGFRDVIEALQPAVLVTAGDADGFCGCHPGHAAVVARAEGLQWFGWPVSDHTPWPGLRLQQRWRVHTPHDLRTGGPPAGVLKLWTCATPPRAA